MDVLEKLIEKYPALEGCQNEIREAGNLLIDTYKKKRKLLVCGNGGSSSDADHIVGELMKSFSRKRPLKEELARSLKLCSKERGPILAAKLESGLPAISLNAHGGLVSAISNDIGGDFIFAQQVGAYGKKDDLFLGISTSGNSQNVVDAAITAKAKGLKVIGLIGKKGGILKEFCDVAICVPSDSTAAIQEFHLPIYHVLCILAEEAFF